MPDLDRVIAGLRCRDLLMLLTDLVDGALEADVMGPVDAHLGGCTHCAKFGTEYGALVRHLKRRLGPLGPPADVRARLDSRMRAVWASE